MQHIEQFWKPIGHLILAFSETERMTFIYLLQQCGLKLDAARYLFSSDARIHRSVKALKSLAKATGIDASQLEKVFNQVGESRG
jgi:hypothetical protein